MDILPSPRPLPCPRPGPPLSESHTITESSYKPRARSEATIPPTASSMAETMPRYARRPGSLTPGYRSSYWRGTSSRCSAPPCTDWKAT